MPTQQKQDPITRLALVHQRRAAAEAPQPPEAQQHLPIGVREQRKKGFRLCLDGHDRLDANWCVEGDVLLAARLEAMFGGR